MSNEGNVMLRMTADSCGRHDTSAGACSCESNTVRFGHGTKYLHACRDNFVLEVTKHGMSKRDIVPNINFFMNVPIKPNGEMTIVDGISHPAIMSSWSPRWMCSASSPIARRSTTPATASIQRRSGCWSGTQRADRCSRKF
jgi:hypothetical protein